MFYCKYCDEEFKDAKALKKHERVCEMNPSNERSNNKFRCNYCHATFKDKDALRAHIKHCSYAPSKEEIDEIWKKKLLTNKKRFVTI